MILSARFKSVLAVCGLVALVLSIMLWSVCQRPALIDTVPDGAATSTAVISPAPDPLRTLEDTRSNVVNLEHDMANMLALMLAPRDEKERPLLTKELARFLLGKGWDLRIYAPISADWNESISYSDLESVKVEGETGGYVLTVPYQASWGNAHFGVQPFEKYEEGRALVIFGPIITNLDYEIVGVQRTTKFVVMDKRTEAEALTDEDGFVGEEPCSSHVRRPLPTDIVRIGAFRALRLEDRNCEYGTISYEVFGREQNYLFTAHGVIPNENLLRWTIERFQEK